MTTNSTANKKKDPKQKRDNYEFAIAIFKLVKGTLLLAVAIGAISLLHKDVAEVVTYRIYQLGIDPQSYSLQKYLSKLWSVDSKDITLISLATFGYSAIFLTEGFGLLMRKGWAEYLTVITTTSFIPWEVWEVIEKFSYFKVFVILLNVATVIYLIFRIKARRKEKREAHA